MDRFEFLDKLVDSTVDASPREQVVSKLMTTYYFHMCTLYQLVSSLPELDSGDIEVECVEVEDGDGIMYVRMSTVDAGGLKPEYDVATPTVSGTAVVNVDVKEEFDKTITLIIRMEHK